ncbi:MAG: hypothetical protein E7636_05980 [Ruminococcaceae bacterium]|nr:hypothetical protein [Oscillospiraceae bacterium]
MEKLHISPQKTRCVLRHGGNEVLLLTYPTLTGDTPAALHTAALIEALIAHARESALSRAAEALREAAASGRLFDFKRHTYDISLLSKMTQKHLHLTLRVCFSAGEETLSESTLHMLWDTEETLQCRAPHARTLRASRKIKS